MNFELVFTDIDNFWQMYDKIKHLNGDDKRKEIIQKDYFNKASIGLMELINKDKITTNIFNEFLKDTVFYNSIRETTLNAKNDAIKIRNHIKSLIKIYPKAKFKNTYFVMGIFRHGGTVMNCGIVIGLELLSKTKKTKHSILPKRIIDILVAYNDLIPIVIHEQVHISQDNKKTHTLLSSSITEGCADFLMYLQIKFFPLQCIATYEYGERNEFKLWQQFKTDLTKNYQDVIKNWFYNYHREDIVPDLGYFIGFKICESYYNKIEDKSKAIEFLMTENDHSKILELSNYNGGK